MSSFFNPISKITAALCLMVTLGCGGESAPATPKTGILRLATTTSTRDSGLLDELLPEFEQMYHARVDVIAAGTGKALKLGEAGDVDVVLVHARAAEEAFMDAGHGRRREKVMHNTFEIVGPADDPAKVKDLPPGEALQRIAGQGAKFLSRGDDSGTHQREGQLWRDTLSEGPPLQGSWVDYLETGQGMGATLTMADEMQGYTLVDRGTFLKYSDKVDLVTLVAGDDSLANPYGVMVVKSAKDPELADAFVDYLISEEVQGRIGGFRVQGEPLFYPRDEMREEMSSAKGD